MVSIKRGYLTWLIFCFALGLKFARPESHTASYLNHTQSHIESYTVSYVTGQNHTHGAESHTRCRITHTVQNHTHGAESHTRCRITHTVQNHTHGAESHPQCRIAHTVQNRTHSAESHTQCKLSAGNYLNTRSQAKWTSSPDSRRY
jgi:hypothetical protein